MTFFLFLKLLFHHPDKRTSAETPSDEEEGGGLARLLRASKAPSPMPVPPKPEVRSVPHPLGGCSLSEKDPVSPTPLTSESDDDGAEMIQEMNRENVERQFREDARRGQQLAQNGNYSDTPDAEHGGAPNAPSLNDGIPVDCNDPLANGSSDPAASSSDASSLNSDCGTSSCDTNPPCDTNSSCDTTSSCDTSSSYDNTPSSWDNGSSGNDFGGGSCGGNDPFGL